MVMAYVEVVELVHIPLGRVRPHFLSPLNKLFVFNQVQYLSH